jgi:urease accessory protein
MKPAVFERTKAHLEINVVSGQSAVTSAAASHPLKLLLPRARGPSVWAYLSSFGGGFVAGDETSLDVRLGAEARCFVTTQAHTKIYRNPGLRPCGHALRAELEAGSLLVLAPDPIQSFAGSTYYQRQVFYLQPGASLVLLDWFCSGRAARRERWSLTRLQSRNEVFLGQERLLLDSLLLDQAQGPLDGPNRMGRYNCLALLVLIGPMAAAAAARMLAKVETLPVTRRADLIVSASPIRQGAMLRIAGECSEDVGREVRRQLGFAAELLGDDPWARKW